MIQNNYKTLLFFSLSLFDQHKLNRNLELTSNDVLEITHNISPAL